MRLFGVDVLNKINNILVTSLNSMISTIATERGDTDLLPIKKIQIGISERQFPECVISLMNSDVKNDENLTMSILQTPEEFPIEVVVILKDNTDKIHLRQEYYIEAFQRVLHGYSDNDVDWIVVNSCIRDAAYTEQKELLKVVGVNITLRTL